MDIVQAENLFVQRMYSKNLSQSTVKNYASQLRLFLRCFEKRDRARNITANEIEQYLLSKVEINTRKHARCAIQLFYKIVVQQPMKLDHVPWPKKEQKLIEYVTAEEVQKILSVCSNLKHKTIIVLTFSCGLRISEVLNLRAENIDSTRMLINIVQAKGNKDRQVQLPEELLKLLRLYWKEYKPQRGYLFEGQFEPKYSERSINQFLKKYAKLAGIKRNIHCHLLRHGFATESLEMGTDIRLIQKLLGHNSIKTTLRYTHVSSNLIAKTPSPISLLKI